MEKRYRAKQASDSLLVGGLLSMSGGLQDAYTYHVRDQVFANAQTGNIVLLGQSIALGNWETAVRYLLPLLAFAAGVYLSAMGAAGLRRGDYPQPFPDKWRGPALAA